MTIPTALHSKLFAEYMDTIKMLYEVDDDFRTLCNDYLTSRTNSEKLKVISHVDHEKLKEFEFLSSELEKEILDYVKKIT